MLGQDAGECEKAKTKAWEIAHSGLTHLYERDSCHQPRLKLLEPRATLLFSRALWLENELAYGFRPKTVRTVVVAIEVLDEIVEPWRSSLTVRSKR